MNFEELHLEGLLTIAHCISHTATMRFLRLAAAALLPVFALSAKKSTGDRFQDYNAQQLSASKPVKLDDSTYTQLTKAPRDYSVAVLLTALDARFGCGLCHDFQPEWELLGWSWAKGDKQQESRLVFGTLDFADGKATFQSVCIRCGRYWILWISADMGIVDAANRPRAAPLPTDHRPSREA